MKKSWLLMGTLLFAVPAAQAEGDHTGLMSVTYTVGPNFIMGGSEARDAGSVQPGVGTSLNYGYRRNIDLTFSYDYIHADLHTQALTFGGQYRLTPIGRMIPLAGAGI